MYYPTPTMESTVAAVQNAASTIGVSVTLFAAKNGTEINAAIAKLSQDQADALLILANPLFANRRVQLAIRAARHGIPTIYGRREFTEAGGLMSYGANITEQI